MAVDEVAHGRDRGVADLDDDVAVAQAGLRRRAVRRPRRALGAAADARLGGGLRPPGHGPRCRARVGAATVLDQVAGHDPSQVDGHGPYQSPSPRCWLMPIRPRWGRRGRPPRRVGRHDVGLDEPVQGPRVLAVGTRSRPDWPPHRTRLARPVGRGGRWSGPASPTARSRAAPSTAPRWSRPCTNRTATSGRRVHARDGADELGPVDGLDPHLVGIPDELRRGQDVPVVAENDPGAVGAARSDVDQRLGHLVHPAPAGSAHEDRRDPCGQPLARRLGPRSRPGGTPPRPHAPIRATDAPSPRRPAPGTSADRFRWR